MVLNFYYSPPFKKISKDLLNYQATLLAKIKLF